MRKKHGLAAVVLASLCASSAMAQASGTQDSSARLERLEQRLTELETRYQAQLQAKDAEINRLKAQLQTQPTAATTPSDSIEKTRQEILGDIEKPEASPLTLRTPASFNPDIAVVTDFRGSLAPTSDNPARNRFDIGSVELDLRAAVDPRADAVAVLPVSREVEDPLFFDPHAAAGGVDTSVELEEAYLFLHDFGVENLTARLGRFHLRFGRQNILHAHDWPTVDNNFVNQSFLGGEALSDSGLSLSYVIPPKAIGGNYVEVISEIISGEGGGDEAPVLNNSAMVQSPALNEHILWNHDIARDWNLELGASFLAGNRNDDAGQNVFLYGADLTLTHTDPHGGFNNQLFQFEGIYGDVSTAPGESAHAKGAYLLAQQQINRDYYFGCRLDWTQNAVDDRQEVWGISPYVSWYWSEFLRFRLEYQHKQGDTPTEDALYLQVTWIFGAHPPHPYWAAR